MANTKLKDAATSLFDILEPLSEDERTRAIDSALLLLGQTPASMKDPRGSAKPAPQDATVEVAEGSENLGPKAKRWAAQNSITVDMLTECFHLDANPPEVVADVPGKSAKAKVVNCYLLTGTAFLLKTDDPSFNDSVARNVCEHVGCLDSTNHAKYTKFGNRISGDKKKGWKLLAPGLKDSAELIKAITNRDTG